MMLLALLAAPLGQTNLQDCEACGLLVWRMQVIAMSKANSLQHVKRASEKRAKKSTGAEALDAKTTSPASGKPSLTPGSVVPGRYSL